MPHFTAPDKFVVSSPEVGALPIVFDSPHSGLIYPPDFRTVAPPEAVRTTCDRFVDELYRGAVAVGAAQVSALFPRAYVDANRALSDLDPAMIDGTWEGPIEPTEYTSRGMGVVRRFALPGIPLYASPLTPAEITHRFETYYKPYRTALKGAIDVARESYGVVYHINCHSMKSRGNEMNVDTGSSRPDFVVSDRLGTTCDPAITAWTATFLKSLGYSVKVNDPYRGGDLIRTFGKPWEYRHSLQIEINRRLYLDESTYEKSGDFEKLQANLSVYLEAFATYVKQAVTKPRP